MLGISEVAESIGFRTTGVKISFERLKCRHMIFSENYINRFLAECFKANTDYRNIQCRKNSKKE